MVDGYCFEQHVCNRTSAFVLFTNVRGLELKDDKNCTDLREKNRMFKCDSISIWAVIDKIPWFFLKIIWQHFHGLAEVSLGRFN